MNSVSGKGYVGVQHYRTPGLMKNLTWPRFRFCILWRHCAWQIFFSLWTSWWSIWRLKRTIFAYFAVGKFFFIRKSLRTTRHTAVDSTVIQVEFHLPAEMPHFAVAIGHILHIGTRWFSSYRRRIVFDNEVCQKQILNQHWACWLQNNKWTGLPSTILIYQHKGIKVFFGPWHECKMK